MKATFFTLLFLFFAYSAFAQTAITGLGPFKIGVTTPSDMAAIAKEIGTTIKNASSTKDMYDWYNPVVKRLATQTGKDADEISEGSFCPAVEVYYVSRYPVGDITLRSLYLFFAQGKLFRIRSTDGYVSFQKTFETKYGKGRDTTKVIEHPCLSEQSGQPATLIRKQAQWNAGTIETAFFYMDRKRYNLQCKQFSSYDFYLEDTQKAKEVDACEREGFQAARKNAIARQKDKLKDF